MERITLLLLCLVAITSTGFAQTDHKQELKKLAEDIIQQVKARDVKRLAVASFVDQQNNVTELGKYLAQQFSVSLIQNGLKNGLEIVDRSRIDMLMEENKMNSQGLLDPENQAKLQKLAGIEVIITGTTTPLDKTVELTLSGIHLSKGSAIAATNGTIIRTEAINNLLRSSVGRTEGGSNSSKTPFLPDAPGQNENLWTILMGDKFIDMKKEDCLQNGMYHGQVCLENTTKEALVVSHIYGGSNYKPNMLVAPGARNCTANIRTQSTTGILSVRFVLHTVEEDTNRKYGSMNVNVDGCKVTVRVIDNNRLFMSKTNPKY
ncbi:FlgO family outer membrane protein [Persicitalea jodogahamensis]|uniref:FlgO domain-containing protein n=1 Tax=Persicitalea jodogahamensis TaxID=402147 RepID=A0A8J3D8V1_9BACT|nr:FlgO family outer membrane protein [Persicitalea jodogahamensis]GHB88955.1 hypothetical protein GCM10007390_51360 [Persicitalea jodogahamensis]